MDKSTRDAIDQIMRQFSAKNIRHSNPNDGKKKAIEYFIANVTEEEKKSILDNYEEQIKYLKKDLEELEKSVPKDEEAIARKKDELKKVEEQKNIWTNNFNMQPFVPRSFEGLENEIKRREEYLIEKNDELQSLINKFVTKITAKEISLNEELTILTQISELQNEILADQKIVDSFKKSFKETTGREYNGQLIKTVKLTESQVEKLYIELYKGQSRGSASSSNIETIENFIKANVDENINLDEIKQNAKSETIEQLYKEDIDVLLESAEVSEYINSILSIKNNTIFETKAKMSKKYKEIIDRYYSKEKMKEPMYNYLLVKIVNILYSKYNVNEYEFKVINELVEIYNKAEKLDVDSENFVEEHNKIVGDIAKLKQKVDQQNLGIKLDFSEETQKLVVEFDNPNIAKQERIIVSPEILSRLKNPTPAQPTSSEEPIAPLQSGDDSVDVKPITNEPVTPTSNEGTSPSAPDEEPTTPLQSDEEPIDVKPITYEPVTPEPTTSNNQPSEIKEGIRKYMALIEEYNNCMATINSDNNVMALLSSSVDDILQNNIPIEMFGIETRVNQVVAKEQNIAAARNKIQDIKKNLSDIRRDYIIKYGIFINQVEEIVNIQITKEEYKDSFEKYLNEFIPKIVNAERKVATLYEEYKESTPERKGVLQQQISSLIKYIEVLNSILDRRAITESMEQNKGIVELLEARRTKKHEYKKQLEKEQQSPSLVEEPELGQTIEPEPTQEDIQEPTQSNEPSSDETSLKPEESEIKDNSQIIIKMRNLNLVNTQKVDNTIARVMNSTSQLKVEVLKNSIRIRYTKQLKEKLRQINAKISLIKKADEEEVTMSKEVKTKNGFVEEYTMNDNSNPEDYKIMISSEMDNENYIYETDLDEVVRIGR